MLPDLQASMSYDDVRLSTSCASAYSRKRPTASRRFAEASSTVFPWLEMVNSGQCNKPISLTLGNFRQCQITIKR